MPVDAQPHPDGNIRLRPRAGSAPLADVLAPRDRFGRAGQLRRSHFASCPDANRYRTPTRNRAST
jgi:hypothetical protein